MRDHMCIVATVSGRRFEKDVRGFEVKDLIFIALVGANFVHGDEFTVTEKQPQSATASQAGLQFRSL